VSDEHSGGDAEPYESTASLRLANGPLVAPVLCRVVSMVLARANCPVDRLDDALLICDALSAHAPDHSQDGHLSFVMSARRGGFELRVGELPREAAARLVRDTEVPGVGSVLERVSSELRVESATDGNTEELVLELLF
jgi:hypothetical protein